MKAAVPESTAGHLSWVLGPTRATLAVAMGHTVSREKAGGLESPDSVMYAFSDLGKPSPLSEPQYPRPKAGRERPRCQVEERRLCGWENTAQSAAQSGSLNSQAKPWKVPPDGNASVSQQVESENNHEGASVNQRRKEFFDQADAGYL